MVDGFCSPEDNRVRCVIGQQRTPSPGSESMACIHSRQVNVGGPESSAKEKQYRRTSPAGEDAEKALRKSDGS